MNPTKPYLCVNSSRCRLEPLGNPAIEKTAPCGAHSDVNIHSPTDVAVKWQLELFVC